MKKLALILVFALVLSLTSCIATKVDVENIDDVKTEDAEAPKAPVIEENEEIVLPEDMELPWADGPIETPIIPPTFAEDEPVEPVAPDATTEAVEPTEPVAPAPTTGPNELPISQIVPEANETPAIPIN